MSNLIQFPTDRAKRRSAHIAVVDEWLSRAETMTTAGLCEVTVAAMLETQAKRAPLFRQRATAEHLLSTLSERRPVSTHNPEIGA